MPVFRAAIVNLIGFGEAVTRYRNGGWARDKFILDLSGKSVTIKQRKSVLRLNRNEARGRQISSSFVFISGVESLDAGIEITTDLCWLLSFASGSGVRAFSYSYGKTKRWHAVSCVSVFEFAAM